MVRFGSSGRDGSPREPVTGPGGRTVWDLVGSQERRKVLSVLSPTVVEGADGPGCGPSVSLPAGTCPGVGGPEGLRHGRYGTLLYPGSCEWDPVGSSGSPPSGRVGRPVSVSVWDPDDGGREGGVRVGTVAHDWSKHVGWEEVLSVQRVPRAPRALRVREESPTARGSGRPDRCRRPSSFPSTYTPVRTDSRRGAGPTRSLGDVHGPPRWAWTEGSTRR